MIFSGSEPPQYIVYRPQVVKRGIWFTYRNKCRTIKISGQTEYLKKKRTSAICYVSQVLTPLRTLRYTKRTCTLAGFHILARKRKFGKTPKMSLIPMISQLIPELV